MKILLSKHAQEKVSERRIEIQHIERVLNHVEYRFYDIFSKAFISIAQIRIESINTNLIVVHKSEKDQIKIVTAYPCRDIEKEIKRKEGSRWIRIK